MLKVRIVDVPTGKAVLLCDEHGQQLPNQVAVAIEHDAPDDLGRVTVTFAIDGRRVAYSD